MMMNKDINYTKLRGGFYTPNDMATFLANWAIQDKENTMLEPSCGDGTFVEAACNRFIELGNSSPEIVGIEIDPDEAEKTRDRISNLNIGLGNITIESDDFFSYSMENFIGNQVNRSLAFPKKKFDVILGNPPFVRYQNFPTDSRKIAFSLMKEINIKPTKLSNMWLPFLVVSASLLNKNGRLAMIIPAGLFQVDYAAEARKFLSVNFSSLNIITFEKLAFENVQQDILLLMGRKNHKEKHGIRIFSLSSKAELDEFSTDDISREVPKELDHTKEKWTQYYLSKEELNLVKRVKEHPLISKARELYETNVGIVTGRNKFFILSKEQVEKYNIQEHVKRIVSRSEQLKGILFGNGDWEKNRDQNQRTYLFSPPNLPFKDLPKEAQEYIKYGEEMEYHTGYKCRIRDLWYIVPSQWKPDAFMLRQVHAYPKLILNKTNASCTDTIHRVKFAPGIDQKKVTVLFLNSLTFAFSELLGRSYGGGVLTFEPSESLEFLIPQIEIDKYSYSKIDSLIRRKDIEKVLDITDDLILSKGIGLSDKDISSLRKIWKKLRDRRLGRK